MCTRTRTRVFVCGHAGARVCVCPRACVCVCVYTRTFRPLVCVRVRASSVWLAPADNWCTTRAHTHNTDRRRSVGGSSAHASTPLCRTQRARTYDTYSVRLRRRRLGFFVSRSAVVFSFRFVLLFFFSVLFCFVVFAKRLKPLSPRAVTSAATVVHPPNRLGLVRAPRVRAARGRPSRAGTLGQGRMPLGAQEILLAVSSPPTHRATFFFCIIT